MRQEVFHDEKAVSTLQPRVQDPCIQLRRWRDQYHLMGDEAFPGLAIERDEEVTELKRRLKKAEQERDFLRDAAVFFAKESK
jgi:transposase-like protein